MLHGIPIINYRKNYTGKEVREMLAIYREKYYQAMRRGNVIRKRLKKFKAKKNEIVKGYDKRYKLTYLRLHGEKGRYKKMKAKYVRLLKEEKMKTKLFMKEQIKEIRKQERNKFRYYYYNPNIKSNPGKHDVIAWARIFVKLNIVCAKTKLKPREVVAILWISSHEEGTATSSIWHKQFNIRGEELHTYCKRLAEFNLVKIQMVKKRYVFDLTERGRKFIEPIIEFVKKEHAHAKRVKRKIIRNRVQDTHSTGSVQDGGESVQ